MSVKDLAIAEEALSLPAAERAGLVKLLVDSLEGGPHSDEEIRADLQRRFQDLRCGNDKGMTFGEVFDETL